MICSALEDLDCQVARQPFTARTPVGPIEMCNIVAKFGTSEDRTTVLSGHYDTIRPDVVLPTGRTVRCWRTLRRLLGRAVSDQQQFVGANDGGSSAALLLEMARLLDGMELAHDVWVALFDGEEALVEWSLSDQTYGSRHQVHAWQADGVLDRIDALINVDMIGARGLQLVGEANSSGPLRQRVWQVAHRCGYARSFLDRTGKAVGDDHVPFVDAGVAAVDLIDAEYGPNNGFWHTLEDGPDKLCAHSFGMVAHVLYETLREMGVAEHA